MTVISESNVRRLPVSNSFHMLDDKRNFFSVMCSTVANWNAMPYAMGYVYAQLMLLHQIQHSKSRLPALWIDSGYSALFPDYHVMQPNQCPLPSANRYDISIFLSDDERTYKPYSIRVDQHDLELASGVLASKARTALKQLKKLQWIRVSRPETIDGAKVITVDLGSEECPWFVRPFLDDMITFAGILCPAANLHDVRVVCDVLRDYAAVIKEVVTARLRFTRPSADCELQCEKQHYERLSYAVLLDPTDYARRVVDFGG